MDLMSTAIILGNGPSLRGFDFALDLKGFTTFGTNVAYRHWNKINWYPTYYACLDPAICESHKDEILELIINRKSNGIKSFMLRANIVSYIEKKGFHEPCIVNFDFWQIRNGFAKYFSQFFTTGALTTLWAASLGYKDLILLGIDANFPVEKLSEAQCHENMPKLSTSGKDHYRSTLLKIEKDPIENKNYFFDDYQKKGDFYFMSDKNKYTENQVHIKSWEAMPDLIKLLGANVVNANINSNINFFPKVSWDILKKNFDGSK